MANIFIVTAKSCGVNSVKTDQFGYSQPTDEPNYNVTLEYCASYDVAHDCLDQIVRDAIEGLYFSYLPKTKLSDLMEHKMPYRENPAIVRQIVVGQYDKARTHIQQCYILEIERKRLKE